MSAGRGLRQLYRRFWPGSAQTAFTRIYREQTWGSEGGGSGRGSSVANTAQARAVLSQVMADHGIHSLLDAGCGALAWTDQVIAAQIARDPRFRYHGIDIVPAVIDANRARLRAPQYRFDCADLTAPQAWPGYDLILCRDALQHLPYAAIAGICRSFALSAPRYLLLTSFNGCGDNRDIAYGQFFRCDLQSPPFGFSDGLIARYDDHRPTGRQQGQQLNLYDFAALAASPGFRAFVTRYARA